MSKKFSYLQDTAKRIHIAPVGYEEDRIVEPILVNKADKVWLLTNYPDEKEALKFLKEVERRLEENNIKFQRKKTDIFNMIDVLQKMNEILKIENGNDIYVNISSGSKITAVALALGCMMWQGKPYYVKPEDYKLHRTIEDPISTGVKDIFRINLFPIDIPVIEHLDILSKIKKSNEKVTRKKLIDFLIDQGKIKEKSSLQAKYNLLSRKYLKPLLDMGYIEFDEIERLIVLTSDGSAALKIFGEDTLK